MTRYTTIESNEGKIMIGDRIRFEMADGEPAEAMAVKEMEDGSGLFIFTDCLRTEYRLHKLGEYPGWEKCELREKLNGEILALLPEDLKARLVPFENGDLLRIPTEREIFGENPYGELEPESVEQFEPMKDRRWRIAFQGYGSGAWEWYWLQNRSVDSATYACLVYILGNAHYYGASNSRGVRPLFQYR